MTRLNNETIKLIRSTPQLFANVATTMAVMPSSLETLLRKNGKRLTEYEVLKTISDFTGKLPEELIEEVADENEFNEQVTAVK